MLLEKKELVVAPGAHDVLTALVIEKCGFPVVYMTGYGQAASHLGRPDIGLMSMTEMVARARNMAAVVDIPVIADADTGFGNVINVIRTVREYEAANVAANKSAINFFFIINPINRCSNISNQSRSRALPLSIRERYPEDIEALRQRWRRRSTGQIVIHRPAR